MKCPKCGGKAMISEAKHRQESQRTKIECFARTRECYECLYRFGTCEITADDYKHFSELKRSIEQMGYDLRKSRGN